MAARSEEPGEASPEENLGWADFNQLSGRMLGEFILREQIDEGGYGDVYRAEQPSLKRDVVVKVLRERRRYDDVARDRFLREARLASRLDHPYAAHVYASGVADEDGLLWIAMELVQGITLNDWLVAHGPMPLEQFVPFFEYVAEVVHAAHKRGIVHRDLKPANVMVIEREGRLIPKLLDFGIALPLLGAVGDEPLPIGSPGDPVVTASIRVVPRRVRRTRTKPGTVVPGGDAAWDRLTPHGCGFGSLAYMSPEQWTTPFDVGPATDIYSLGIVAYEALTGRVPFHAESTDGYHRQHVYADAPRLGGRLSPGLDHVIQRALAKQPEDRYGSALDLAAAMRAAVHAQPGERLRALAKQWDEQARPNSLLRRGDELADLDRWSRGSAPLTLDEPAASFVTASRRRARLRLQLRWSLGVLAATLVFGVFQYRSAMQARMAQRIAEVTITQSELEQGRAALLHGEPQARAHLAEAYKRDPSPATAFMFARALQPRLAEQARFASSSGRMWSAAFSPDGTRLVTSDDQDAQVWDAQTYGLLFTLRHGTTVYQAIYSKDATRVITAGGDGVVRIWDATSGRLRRELKDDDKHLRYGAVSESPDGKLVAAIDVRGQTTLVWDTLSGARIAELRNDALDVFSVAFSADGRWLATSGGNSVRVFDARTWTQVGDLPGHRLSWDPTGPRLLTGGVQGDVSIWTLPSGLRIRHLRELGEPVNRVAFAPDGKLVVAASDDGAEQVWETATGNLRSQGNLLHGKILSVEFDRTSSLLVAAGANGSVAVSDASTGMPVAVLEGPGNVIRVAQFDPSARRVVGASWDGTARIWAATAPYRRWSSPPVNGDCGLVTSLEPDRRFVAVGCRNQPTRIWDTKRDQLLAELPSVTQIDGGNFGSAYPAVSAAGDRAAIARGSVVEVFGLPDGRLLRTIAHAAPVNAVAFASVGRDLVSGSTDGSVLVTRDNGALLVLPTSSAGIDAAGFLPDGRVVVSDARRRLRIYDPTGGRLADFEAAARVRTLRMSLDGRRLLTIPGLTESAVSPQLWDVEHYRLIGRLENEAPVYSARFLPDGQMLTACGDGAARLWDGDGHLRQTYGGGSRLLIDATLSLDGSMILAGGGDGALRFWEVSSARLLWVMPAHRSSLVGIHVEGDDIVTRGYSGDISRWTLPEPATVVEACGDRDRCAIVSR